LRLQGQTVSQAGSMLPETLAKPQTVRLYGKALQQRQRLSVRSSRSRKVFLAQ
jgi:hypothetical protein